MRWPLWVWERITGIPGVKHWAGRNVISALASFTVLIFLLALALIFREWGFSQTQRFILIIAACILMGLSMIAGIGLSIAPGDSLSFWRVFGTERDPLTRRQARMATPVLSTSQLPSPPDNRENQS